MSYLLVEYKSLVICCQRYQRKIPNKNVYSNLRQRRRANLLINEGKICALTVLRGSMSANLNTFSNASSKGLHTTGVLGSTISESGWRMYSQKSKISAVFGLVSLPSLPSGVLVLLKEFRVSKLIMLSKQSSSPRLWSTLKACPVSALVKIWKKKGVTKNRHHITHTSIIWREPSSLNHVSISLLLTNNTETYNFSNWQALQNAPENRVRFQHIIIWQSPMNRTVRHKIVLDAHFKRFQFQIDYNEWPDTKNGQTNVMIIYLWKSP